MYAANRRNAFVKLAALCAGALVVSASGANATITWDWSFGGESGTFITDGTASGGVAAPGVYTLQEFTVTSSTAGMSLGSDLGGQYNDSGFFTNPPYTFDWNGSSVTQWNQSGLNTFDWWVFDSTSNTSLYFTFAETPGNINDPTQATVLDDTNPISPTSLDTGTISLSVVAAPEPAIWALMLVGFAGMGAAFRARRRPATA